MRGSRQETPYDPGSIVRLNSPNVLVIAGYLKAPNLVTTSDPKHQTEPGQHGREVDGITRCAWGVRRG